MDSFYLFDSHKDGTLRLSYYCLKEYYFGMEIHISTDVNSNAIHNATITPANTANTANITELSKLLRERDRVVFADTGYTSDSYKKEDRH